MRSWRCCHGNSSVHRLRVGRHQVRRSRKTTFCAFKCGLSLSLLIPCHTQLPLHQRWGGGGLYRAPRKIWRTVVVPAWTFQREGARAHSEVNTHVCHCSFTSERLWQKKKAFSSQALKENVRKMAGNFSESLILLEICTKLQLPADGVPSLIYSVLEQTWLLVAC